MKRLLQKIFGPRVKKTTAGEISKMFGLKLEGDPKTIITGIAPIADAKPGDITLRELGLYMAGSKRQESERGAASGDDPDDSADRGEDA